MAFGQLMISRAVRFARRASRRRKRPSVHLQKAIFDETSIDSRIAHAIFD